MNKNQLSKKLSLVMDIPKTYSDQIINNVFAIMRTALKEEKRITILDFATFTVKKRKGRKIRDITTDETINVPDFYELRIKASNSLKEYLNEDLSKNIIED